MSIGNDLFLRSPRHKDKHGGCCDAPHALDAMFDCCHLAVDECGVCGGEGSSCAISAVVTLVVPFSGALVDKLSGRLLVMGLEMRQAHGHEKS